MSTGYSQNKTTVTDIQSVTTVKTEKISADGTVISSIESEDSNNLTNPAFGYFTVTTTTTKTTKTSLCCFNLCRNSKKTPHSNGNEYLAVKDVKKFEKECLLAHNKYRRKHGSPDLKLNKSICKYAQEWANQLAADDQMHYRNEQKYGENIYWANDGTTTGTSAVDAWYNEIQFYSFNDNVKFSPTTAHFTQVIWKQTRDFGVGIARNNSSGALFIVAYYDPPGNFGEFKENVLPL